MATCVFLHRVLTYFRLPGLGVLGPVKPIAMSCALLCGSCKEWIWSKGVKIVCNLARRFRGFENRQLNEKELRGSSQKPFHRCLDRCIHFPI